MSAGAVALFTGGFAAGLVAGTASCTAVQGGLLAGLTPRAGLTPGAARTRPALRTARTRQTPETPPTRQAPEAPPNQQFPESSPTRQAPEAPRVQAVFRASRSRGSGCHAPADRSGPKAVALFLAGRFTSHVAAGALLGLLGSAVRPGPSARAVLLVAAGITVAGFGLRMLVRRRAPRPPRVPADPGAAPETRCSGAPAPESAGPEGSGLGTDAPGADAPPGGASPGGARALLLGAVTILMPCGVTLSAEAAAVSTGSAAGGAAVMAGFALGSAPAFALLGLALRRLASTRLAALAGVAVLVTGLWTAGSGLRLGGWLPSPGAPAAAAPTAGPAGASGVQRIEIWATGRGYRPGVVTARAGAPVELVFRLTGAPGCTRTLTLDGRDVVLPATVRLAPRGPGSLRYVCSMGMYTGFVNFVG
ncbi:sulfite exporter TauE/SafE family protein [Planomonospora corallina]|uniref:Sulfite exporter TauE/SafE family protein n=1 Tax=Planomonospora corallina TaxID=1806052 RepID=A0ABV8I583_9ACTN